MPNTHALGTASDLATQLFEDTTEDSLNLDGDRGEQYQYYRDSADGIADRHAAHSDDADCTRDQWIEEYVTASMTKWDSSST